MELYEDQAMKIYKIALCTEDASLLIYRYRTKEYLEIQFVDRVHFRKLLIKNTLY